MISGSLSMRRNQIRLDKIKCLLNRRELIFLGVRGQNKSTNMIDPQIVYHLSI